MRKFLIFFLLATAFLSAQAAPLPEKSRKARADLLTESGFENLWAAENLFSKQNHEFSKTKAPALVCRAAADFGPASAGQPTMSLPQPFIGSVLRIWDGDTFDCTDGNNQYRIRINGIDAPEMNQPNGALSRKILASVIGNHKVQIIPIEFDSYGRVMATVLTDEGQDISEILIAYGYAWHYVLYDSNPRYKAAEQKARENRNGIWSQHDSPVQPWLWRAGIRRPIY